MQPYTIAERVHIVQFYFIMKLAGKLQMHL